MTTKIGAGGAFAAILTALLVAGSGSAAAPKCPAGGHHPRVTLTANPGTVRLRAGHTRSDLRRLSRKIPLGGARSGDTPLGLTVAEFHLNMRTSVRVTEIGRNVWCAVPTVVDFTMGYPEFVIYIDRRYKRGSCQFGQIRSHENQHVQVYRNHLTQYAPLVRRQLRRAAQTMKPIRLANAEHAAERVQARLKRRIDPLLAKMQKATEAANARMDTVRSYTRIQQRCAEW